MAAGIRQRVREGDKPKPTRYFSNKQEKSIAIALGGHQQPNSGATPWAKGDVVTDKFLLEAKTKTKSSNSITIQKEWFEKQKQESAFLGKPYTAVVFSFGPDEEQHYIIDEELFQVLLEVLENKEIV